MKKSWKTSFDTVTLLGIVIPCLLFAALPISNAASEIPRLQWSKTFSGDGVTRVIQTTDGGFALVGTSDSLIKIDSSGELQWTKTYGRELGFVVQQISTGDLGFALCYLGGRTSATSSDGWFVKTDSNGNIEWNKTITVQVGYARFTSLIQTSKGFALASSGTQWNMSEIGGLLKSDGNGNVIWSRTYSYPIASATQTDDGGYALIAPVGADHQPVSGTLFIRTDAKGDMKFNKTYENIIASSIIETKDKGYLLYGYAGFTVGVIQKIDSTGNVLWKQTFSSDQLVSHICLNSVRETSDGGCIAAGTLQLADHITHPFFAQVDSSGSVMWNVTSDAENPSSVITTRDGGFVTTGSNNGTVWLEKFITPSLSTIDPPTFSGSELETPLSATPTGSNFQTATPSLTDSETPTPSVPEFQTIALLAVLFLFLTAFLILKRRNAYYRLP